MAALREVAGALVVPGEAKKSSIDRDVEYVCSRIVWLRWLGVGEICAEIQDQV